MAIPAPPPSKPHPKNCPDCHHRHLGDTGCHASTGRDNLCLCKSDEGRRRKLTMTDNGKDQKSDGFENVEGKAPEQKPLIGLRVKGVTVTEDQDGGAVGHATVTGPAAASLVKLVGEAVHLETLAGGRAVAGHVRAVTIAEAKKGGAKVITLRVRGARNLDGLVGLQVRLKQAQGELPLVGDAPEASTDQPAAPPFGEVEEPDPPRRRRRTRAGASPA